MWTCPKCNAVNEEIYTVCTKCGASRSAGRFGSAINTPPKNSAAYAAPLVKPAQPDLTAPPPPPPQRPAASYAAEAQQVQYVPDFSHVHAGAGFMALGAVLCALLPALVLLLAWRQHDVLSPVLLRLFFKNAADVAKALGAAVYAALTATAMLIAALPGVFTLGLGKALRRLARMEELL